MKWRRLTLLTIALIVSLLRHPAANAASTYDNLLGTTDDLLVACRGGSVTDFSENWFEHMKAASPTSSALIKLQEKLDNGETSGWALKANKIWSGSPQGSYDLLTLYVTNQEAEYTLGSYAGPITGWNQYHGLVFTGVEYLYTYNYYTYYNDDAATCGGASYYSEGSVRYENNAVTSMGAGYVIEDGIDGRVFVQDYPDQHFLFFNLPFNPPSDYEGQVISTTYVAPPTKYVAIGDSFSSGEGIPSFEYGTDIGGANENRCHRSPQAYPRLLQNDSSLDLGPTAFVACSGATTADVLYGGSGSGAWSEGPQVDALSSDTEIVTITIGGNDVGFSDYVHGCVVAPCGPSTTFYNAILANIESPSFLDNLETAYETTLFEAPNADVYVMDYPHLVDPTGVDIPSCVLGVDMTGATGIQQALNAVIADAVDNVQGISGDYATRLHFVPTNHIGSPFIGHHLCTDDPGGAYFNGLNVWDKVYSFHPNSAGQQAYYEIMEDYLS